MKRRITIVIVFLLFGAFVNVAVAWGCAAFAQAYDETSLGRHAWVDSVAADWPPVASHGWEYSGSAMQVRISRARGPVDEDAWHPPLYGHILFLVGFPRSSMRWCLEGFMEEGRGTLDGWPCESRSVWQSGLRVPIMDRDQWGFQRRLPLRPSLPGFIINTLFYALLLWLLLFAPFTARRVLRRKRRLCEKCAYPVGTSPVCTECGAAVTPRAYPVGAA